MTVVIVSFGKRSPKDRRKPLPEEGPQKPLKLPTMTEMDVADIATTLANLKALQDTVQRYLDSDPTNTPQITAMTHVLGTIRRLQQGCVEQLTPDDT